MCGVIEFDGEEGGADLVEEVVEDLYFSVSQCAVSEVDLANNEVVCLCEPSSFTYSSGSSETGPDRRLGDGEEGYLHEIGHAFLRASIVLST